MGRFAPIPRPVVSPADGTALSGAKIYTYQAGTTTPKATYPTRADSDASTNANTNPVITNSYGYPTTEIWFKNDTAYKVIIKTSDDATTLWSADNLTGIFDLRLADGDSLYDNSGSPILNFDKVASAVNYFTLSI